jgi:hypothetical protein
LGSSGNVGRGGLAELIGTTGSAVGFVFSLCVCEGHRPLSVL